MVMDPVPDLGDLIWLFENEPTYRYAEDDREVGYELDWREMWPYTAVTFALERGDSRVQMYIEPGYHVVRLWLTVKGRELVDLDLRGVQRVAVDRTKDGELLRIEFPERADAETLWLRTKPDISLGWHVGTD